MSDFDVPAVSRIVQDGYTYLGPREGFLPHQLDRLLAECSSPSAILAWLSKSDCFVAQSDSTVVAALAIERNDVAEIWVDVRHRGRGVGTALFRKAEQVVAGAGYDELTVRCAAQSARPFYEGLGCAVVAIRPCTAGPLAGWPLTFYRKQLTTQPTDPSHSPV